METEGDTRTPIVQMAKYSPSLVLGLLSKSDSKGELPPEPIQQAPKKKTSRVATTAKASAIPEQGSTMNASGKPPVKTVAMTAVQAPLPGTKSALQRKPEALQTPARHDSVEGMEEQLLKKGTMFPELEKLASHKCQSQKGKEGAKLRKGTPLTEKERQQPTTNKSDGDGARKGLIVRTKEIEEGIYTLEST